LSALALAGASSPLGAQSPVGKRQSGFELIDDYVLEVGGSIAEDAVLYASRETRAILIVSQELPAPVLLWPRSRGVETLQMLKVARSEGGTAEVLPDPVIAVHAPFLIESPRVKFLVDGVAAALAPKPPLLGLKDTAEMVAHSSVYKQRANAYAPQKDLVDKLRVQDKDVRVRVFFGSWCPACGQMVPRLMRVAEGVGDDVPLKVEYYGLPQGESFSRDPEVQKYGITQVPTGVVLLDGKEIGRISGNQWRSPEGRISELLGIS
jgi:thiol-disulfide isomerase/thioredoxin